MRQDIIEKIEIPENMEVTIENNEVSTKFENKENKRKFSYYGIEIKKQENNILIESKKASRKELKVVHTIKAHINNMLLGVKEPFVYKMEIAFVHFPMTVEQQGDQIIIKNFLGEKKPRTAKILPNVEVKIDKKIITLTSHNKELAGQTAGNFEKATHIRNKDRRKFQDGIYLTEKPGRVI